MKELYPIRGSSQRGPERVASSNPQVIACSISYFEILLFSQYVCSYMFFIKRMFGPFLFGPNERKYYYISCMFSSLISLSLIAYIIF